MNLQLFEDSGPRLGGEPTERHEVINIGWKKSGLTEATPFVEYPINRPTRHVSHSFVKYNYLKISGIEKVGTRARLIIVGDPALMEEYDVRLYYKLTSTYLQPTDSLLTGSMYMYQTENMPVIFPRMSTTDPQDATSHIKWLQPNTTYYTEYFVSQLYVNSSYWDNYGNLGNGSITIRFAVDSYEEVFD